MSETFVFELEKEPNINNANIEPWHVLSVEDDIDYQKTLDMCLSDMTIFDRPVHVHKAQTASEAATFLANNSNISVILLDVVMEEDDAGLKLVNTIRTILGDDRVRIIMLTGQASLAPQKDIMINYDVNEYWNKVDLTSEKLRSLVTANIRSWNALNELFIAKRGLQIIVDASRALTQNNTIKGFTETVLNEVSRVIGLQQSNGIVCVHCQDDDEVNLFNIVASTSKYTNEVHRNLVDYLNGIPVDEREIILDLIFNAQSTNKHQFKDKWNVLFFSTEKYDNRTYLFVIEADKRLEPQHIALLNVFSDNISNRFTNLALLNKLSSLAYYDDRLNLPNRNWLKRELENLKTVSLGETTLVHIKINDFQALEFCLGVKQSRQLLREVYRQIAKRFLDAVHISVVDADTFALLFNVNTVQQQRFIDISELYISHGDFEQHISLTTLITPLFELVNLPRSGLLKAMDIALIEQAKRAIPVQTFDLDIVTKTEQRQALLHELNDALKSNVGIYLVFQPKVEMTTNQTVGFEALVRWKNSEGIVVRPDQFIGLAEESGLITRLDTLVMIKTFEAASELYNKGYRIPISFNVTYTDLINTNFIKKLEDLLSQSLVPAEYFEIEVTETQFMEDHTHIGPTISKILDLGMKVSIDDFGTGYSSLGVITKLSATTIKIDKSFVDELGQSSDAQDVIIMVQQLANKFGFNLVAEGIETELQKQILIENGYNIAQGYLYSKPVTMELVLDWLNNTSLEKSAQ